ncbi:MAG: hypothetical protein D6805_06335 [Planctomycetota bacterium]|nr:MAG: hypothetical protein D6805_06335 [Planctomycetota bacterium]
MQQKKFLHPTTTQILTATLIYIGLMLYYFRNLLFGNHTLFWRDILTISYPLEKILSHYIQNGNVPLWSNQLDFGTPLVAYPLISIYYPTRIFYLLFKFPLAFTLHYAIHFPLAALGTYLCARTWGSSHLAAIVAGAAYGYGGFLTSSHSISNVLMSASWLPYTIYAFLQLEKNWKYPYFFVGSSALAFQLLHPGAQNFLLTLILLATLTLRKIQHKPTFFRLNLILITMTATALLLSSAQTLPTWHYTQNSSRMFPFSTQTQNYYTYHPIRLGELIFAQFLGKGFPKSKYLPAKYWKNFSTVPFFPTLYLGITTTALVLLSLKTKKNQFLATIALVFLLISMGNHLPLSQWIYQLPLLKYFRYPEKFMILPFFLFSILAAQGLDRINSKKLVSLILGLLLLALSTLAIFSLSLYPKTVHLSLLLTWLIPTSLLLLFFLFWHQYRGKKRRILLSILVITDLSIHCAPTIYNAPSKLVQYPSAVAKQLHKYHATRSFHFPYKGEKLKSIPIDYHPFSFAYYYIFREALLPNQPLLYKLPALPLSGPMQYQRPYLWRKTLQHARNPIPLLQTTGIRFFFTKLLPPSSPLAKHSLPLHRWDLLGFELRTLPSTLPTYFLTTQAKTFPSREKLIQFLQKSNPHFPKPTALLEKPLQLPKLPPSPPKIQWKLLSSTNTHIEWEIQSPSTALFVALFSYAEDWKAYLNNQEIPIYPANLIGSAILLPKGHHHLTLEYPATWENIGRILSLLTILTLLTIYAILLLQKSTLLPTPHPSEEPFPSSPNNPDFPPK